jgi:hypothetical protein
MLENYKNKLKDLIEERELQPKNYHLRQRCALLDTMDEPWLENMPPNKKMHSYVLTHNHTSIFIAS